MTDEQLFEAFRQGDEHAWDDLVHRWGKLLIAYAMKRVGDKDRAECITANTFERLRNAKHVECVGHALQATAHRLSGATGDWRNGMTLLLADTL